jgi:RHS repeat-associated protein
MARLTVLVRERVYFSHSSFVVYDQGTSEVVESISYLAYGGIDSDWRSPRWQSPREDVRFTGQWDNAEVGLVYMHARYYSPQLGRFISADPRTILGGGGENAYAYANGSPYRFTDPTGLDGEDPNFYDDPQTTNPNCSGCVQPGPVRSLMEQPTQIIQNDIDQWDLQPQFASVYSAFGDTARAQAASGLAEAYANNAIDWAVITYRINLSNVSRPLPDQTGITFNPNLGQPGLSGLDAQVTPNQVFTQIGPPAFESPGWLGSSIAHEVESHGDQVRFGTWFADPTQWGGS